MLSIFLGAGFSNWAVGLPVAKRLFDFNIEPWGPRENVKIKAVTTLKENWDINNPNGQTEQFIADALKSEDKNKEIVLWYITRRLSEPFIWKEYHAQKWRRHVLMIDENRKFNIPGILKAQKFLQQFYNYPLAGIITTNYDMITEYMLGTKGFNYGVPNQVLKGRGPYPLSQWRNPVTLSGKISLAKIHGSISWDENDYYTDGRRGLTGHALIVAPTPEKRPPESLKFIWKLAKNILEKSTRLVVFGFAFNPYDEAVLKLLQSGRQNLETILLIDTKPNKEIACNLWPDADIVFTQPSSEGKIDIQNWQ
jgi:hypothetical protein